MSLPIVLRIIQKSEEACREIPICFGVMRSRQMASILLQGVNIKRDNYGLVAQVNDLTVPVSGDAEFALAYLGMPSSFTFHISELIDPQILEEPPQPSV